MTTRHESLEIDSVVTTAESVQAWRERTLALLLQALLAVVLSAWLFALVEVLLHRQSDWLAATSVGLVSVATLTFWRRVGYNPRAHGLLLVTCGLSLLSPLNLGLLGLRPIYALGMVVLATVLLERRAAIIYSLIFVALATLPLSALGFGVIMASSSGAQRVAGPTPLLVSSLTMVGIAVTVGGLILSLIARLSRSLIERETVNTRLSQLVDERTAELRRSQSLLQSLLEHAPAAIFLKDLAGRYLLTNGYMQRFNGFTAEQLHGHRDVELFGERVTEWQWRDYERAVLDTGQPIGVEVDIARPEGTYTYQVIRFPLRDENGTIQALGGIGTDITSRKQIEERLGHQLQLQAAVAECAQTLLRATVSAHQRDALLTAVLEAFRVGIGTTHIGLHKIFALPDGQLAYRSLVQMPDNVMRRLFTPVTELRPAVFARLEAGEPVVIQAVDAYVEDSPNRATVQSRGLGRVWLLPVTANGQLWGAVFFSDAPPLQGNEAETLKLLSAVADMVGAFVNRIEIREAIERQNTYARALAACSGALLTRVQHTETESEALREALAYLREAVDGQCAAVYAMVPSEADSCNAHIVARAPSSGGAPEPQAARLSGLNLTHALIAELRAGRPCSDPVTSVLADDQDARKQLLADGITRVLLIPIRIDGWLWGLLLLGATAPERRWSSEELQMLQTSAEMIAAFAQSRQLLRGLRERERFLEERESLLRTTSDALPNGFLYQLIQDREGVDRGINYISAGIEDLLGCTVEDLRAAPVLFDNIVLPEDRPIYQAATREAARTLSICDVELRASRRDGRIGWFQLRAVPQAAADDLILWNGVVLERTGRKEAELARQQANAVLHQRVAELGALNQIAQALMSWIDLPAALTTVGAMLLPLFGAGRIAVWLREDGHDSLRQLSLVGRGVASADGPTVPLRDAPLARQVLAARHGMVLDSGRYDPVIMPPPVNGHDTPTYSVLAQPLLVRGKAIGLLVMHSDSRQRFTPSDVELAQTITGLLSNAIENRRLFQRTMAEAAQEERRRLARELHDSITQSLYSLTLLARAWSRMALAENPTTIATWFRQVEDLALQALKEMRLLIYQLRSQELDTLGLAAMLRQRIEAVEQRTGITVRLDAEGYLVPTAPEVEPHLFAIAQEALNNALRHAQANNLVIVLQSDHAETSMQISDDGQGFDLDASSGGLGLITMRERAEGLGGRMRIITAPGAGTTIKVRMPNRAAPASARPTQRKPTSAARRRR